MEKIILISGKAGHGKDATAQIIKELLEENGKKVAITHYAKHMKDMLREFYNWNGIKDKWARDKLQWMGTEKIRQGMNMPEFHVNRTCENIDIVQEDFDYFLIADCRFPNEISYVDDYFGRENVYAIRVQRLNYQSKLTDEEQKHLSETALDGFNEWDYKIVTSYDSLDYLKNQCKVVVDKILE